MPKSTLLDYYPKLKTSKSSYTREDCADKDVSTQIKKVVSSKNSTAVPSKGSAPKEGSSTISHLSDNLLEYIFSFLNIEERIRNELVCKRWKLLTWNSPKRLSFINDPVNASLHPSKLSDKAVLAIVLRCGSCVNEVELTIGCYTPTLTTEALKIIGQQCPNISVLRLRIPVVNSSLSDIAEYQYCRKLTLLGVEVFGQDYRVGLQRIVSVCKDLRVLGLWHLKIEGEWINDVNPKLSKLVLQHCTLSPEAIRRLTSRCNAVEALHILDCEQIGKSKNELFKAFKHFKRTLKMVHLGNLYTTVNWHDGLSVLENLEELSMVDCAVVDDNLMSTLAKKCKKLATLNVSMSKVSDDGLIALSLLPALKNLDVSDSKYITGYGLEFLASRGRLEVLHVAENREVSESSCISVAKSCRNLKLFDVQDTPQITDKFVIAFREAARKKQFNGPVKLNVGGTSVERNVETCEGLELIFEESSDEEESDSDSETS